MSKLVFYITILLSLFASKTQAQQNLVPNGSFEEYNWCPNTVNGYYIETAKDWYLPTLGSSDYFNSCSLEDDGFGNKLFSVPSNYEGYQNARTGNAYGGYYAALTPSNINYYEYLSIKLITPLKANKSYKLTYYVSVADSFYSHPQPLQFVNHSAAWFSDFQYQSNNSEKIPFTPQIKSNPNEFLNDSIGWQKIDGIFIANGGEEYLTIGYFCNYSDLEYNYLPSSNSDSTIAVYYFIDDVLLVEYDLSELVPNIFSPNNDGINDLFLFDNTILKAEELLILNRWGNVVFESRDIFKWDGTDMKNQLKCSEGVYYFKIKTSNQDINGFIQLVR
ncbi:gliding motility-associated C-terminal domain-containing protein [Fluviicola taffensis]|uniref:T9SS type B sorting domain-containing protein n=1 Tax=Fluviicola taffensis TaxID=191579 RepID=UPI003138107B